MQGIGAIILAAGGSARFGEPKQLLHWQGESLIARTVRVAREAGCRPVVVVTGAASDRIASELVESGAIVVLNPDWERGLGTSIRCGVKHLIAEKNPPEAVTLLACDQPFVSTAVVAALVARWTSANLPMVASRYANTLGIPALFARSCFPALMNLADESGAKTILRSRPGEVAAIEFEAGANDIDTPADYARAKEREPS